MAAIRARSAPRILGLTGAIACGKTTVGDILLELGALERIDADAVVHRLMAAGTPVTAQILRRFGRDIIARNGSVDRSRLGSLVFDDPAALRDLELITHPAVRTAIRDRVAELSGQHGFVVIDAVKLLQSELLELAYVVWVVRCRPDIQMQRLTEVRGMSAKAAAGRLAAQPSFTHPRVTTVIENNGSMDQLQAQVTAAWQHLQSQ
jgi:dephospho-CoA kinase